MQAIYGPHDEQALVRELLGAGPGAGGGVFVDVGANDPVINSQTWHLERLGWTGVLIEPIPECAERLRKERKAQVFQGACGEGEGVMQLHVAGVYSSLLPTREGSVDGVVRVRVRRLDDVLQEAGFDHVDLVSIDVEGFELAVLRGFTLERWQPKLVLIEDHVGDLSKHRYLTSRGYRLVRRTGVNAWYVPRDSAFRVEGWGRWQLFRKYFLGLPLRKLRNALRRVRRATLR